MGLHANKERKRCFIEITLGYLYGTQWSRGAVTGNRHASGASERTDLLYKPIADNHI